MQRINWWNRKLDAQLPERMSEALLGRNLSYGAKGAELERAISLGLDIPHVTLVTSGSVALLVLFRIIGIKPEDEVIIPTRTFQATANAAVFLGGRVVPVEVDKRSLLQASSLEGSITPKTKAIVPVHLNGRACEMQAILDIAKKHGIPVIEDAAQAMFSRSKNGFCGTLGDAGIFSLGVTKFMTTAQGGVIVTRDPRLHAEVRKFLKHAVSFEPQEHYAEFGFNFRLPDLLSVVALDQIQNVSGLREKYLAIYENYRRILNEVDGVDLVENDLIEGEIPTWIEVLCERRDELHAYLKSKNIESRPFTPSLHECGYLGAVDSRSSFENANRFAKQGLVLPCGPDVDSSSFDRIARALAEFR